MGTATTSPFVESLVKRINEKPSLEVRRLFDVVRDDVLEATSRKQQLISLWVFAGS